MHAATNAVAIGTFAASYAARRRGRHQAAASLALAGSAVSAVGAYLGGHLAMARQVGRRHPAFETARS